MSMIASNVASIKAGFEWYVMIFEADTEDPALKKVLHEQFESIGEQVGIDVLVVKGFNAKGFYESAVEAQSLYGDPQLRCEWAKHISSPSLLITDTSPGELWKDPEKLRAANIISIPLEQFRGNADAIAELLRRLVGSFKDENAAHALAALASLKPVQKAQFGLFWGWLRSSYGASLFGFGELAEEIWSSA